MITIQRMARSIELESQTIVDPEVDRESFSIFAAVLLAIRLRVSIWATLGHTLNSDEAIVFFEAFHMFLIFLNSILGGIIGIHFQALNISPLETHLAGINCGLSGLILSTTYKGQVGLSVAAADND
ncbi:hypothetical protein CMV_017319 [Castanea mollissima]|uniref:Uncharacterized protein n=1 Tax=Castanea mollissima TaxID=60419 RepID=A0A8J4QXZ9_9ROSI|nr:hypothetical protein CMV_017319 [Castanea mollissima]